MLTNIKLKVLDLLKKNLISVNSYPDYLRTVNNRVQITCVLTELIVLSCGLALWFTVVHNRIYRF